MGKALDGLVVLDFTRWIAGPWATYLLGQMGAYVIKVEKPYLGEDMRMYAPFYNNESLAFPCYNINKYSLCIDLRKDEAKEIIKQLLPHVDIFAQNFRVGTIEKMGFDWETIHSINPRIIMANMSGFGQTGPYRDRLAYDSIAQSESGLINSIMEESGEGIPFYPGGNNSDHISALCFTSAILAAINQRDRTGKGQYLESDMMSAITSMFSPELSLYGATGSSQLTTDLAPCGYYHDCNGRFVQISCPEARWEDFKRIVGLNSLHEPEFGSLSGRRANKEKLDAILETWTKAHEGKEICNLLEASRIGAALVKNYQEIYEDEHAKAINYFQQIEVPYVGLAPYPGMPFSLSKSPAEFNKAPKIGEHNAEILQRFLGMDDSKIAQLTQNGILYQAEHACWAPK